MLRLSNTLRVAVAAAALLLSTTSFAQGGGLSDRIADADKQLQADTQACKPINLGNYVSLLSEAIVNKQRAAKAAKAGAPIDEAQINADLAKAGSLFSRAQAALVQQCMRQAQAAPNPAQTLETHEGDRTSWNTFQLPSEDWIKYTLEEAQYGLMRDPSYRNYQAFQSLDYFRDGLKKYIEDAKEVGEFGEDVGKAKKMLKQIDDAYDDKTIKLWRRILDAQYAPPPPPVETPVKIERSLNSFERVFLDAHNEARVAVGSPPLKWDPVLAEHARMRAAELAGLGQLVHAPREGRGTERENILQAPMGYSAGQMIERWTREKADFRPGIYPDVCASGDWHTCSHYTQVVWSGTVGLGCGVANGAGFAWLVCRYNPGGNKDGKPVIAPMTSSLAQTLGQQATQNLGHQGQFDPSYRDPVGPFGEPRYAANPDSALSFMINGLLDFGDDDGVSGFIGGGVGVARVDYNNLSAFSRFAESDASDARLAREFMEIYCPSGGGYCETSVLVPELPKGEVFKPKPPEKLEDPM